MKYHIETVKQPTVVDLIDDEDYESNTNNN